MSHGNLGTGTEATGAARSVGSVPRSAFAGDEESLSDAETVLELDGLTRSYGVEDAVSDFSLAVRDGELLTLLGPSGCGK